MKQSIAGRLLRIIFGCYFIVTVVVTAIQLTAEYKHTRSRVEREIVAMEQTFGPGIADAMWRFNDDIMRGILSGMKEIPVVVGIKVVDEQGKIVRAVGSIVDANGHKLHADLNGNMSTIDSQEGLLEEMFSREFPINFTDEGGRKQAIGSWTVYSNQRIIVSQVEYGFLLILINSVIKTMALWFIFLLAVKRWLGRPLQQLSDYVGQLNIDNLGDRPFVLQDRGRHELHVLADKINELSANIRNGLAEKAELNDQLRTLNESLEQRVAERTADLTRDRQQLALANQNLADALNTVQRVHDELARSERLAALGSMVAGVAHELNTPIGNSLIAASTLTDNVHRLAESYETGLRRSEVDRFIHEASTVGELLTRNILRAADLVTSFKQVAVDQTSSQRRSFKLAEVVAENINALSPTLRKTPYVVRQQVADSIVMDSYPGPLGQVLINLINNAILHGFGKRDHGTITISAPAPQDGMVNILFNDDGNGISQEHINRIFDPFFTTRLGEGSSGLGLNITHNIVTTLLGGKIRVESNGKVGTTFWIALPLLAPQEVKSD